MSGTVNPRARGRSVGRRTPARLATAALGLMTAAALAGCGAGQITQTSAQEAGVNGANVTSKDIAIRNAQLAYPDNRGRAWAAGDDVQLELTIVNQGVLPDELKSISSPSAQKVEVTGARKLPGDTALRAEFSEQQPAAPAESSSAASPSAAGPSASGSSASAEPSGSLVPGEDLGKITITVTGLKQQELRPGDTLPLTFDFAKAGDVHIEVPIANPSGSE